MAETAAPLPPAVTAGSGRRVLLYSDDRFGLGHVRPMLATAAALAQRLPGASLLGITGSPQASVFAMPENFDYVKLPTAWKAALFADLPLFPDQRGKQRGIWSLRAALIRRIIADYRPHLVVVEVAVAGAKDELAPALRALRAEAPRCRLALLLYDIVDDSTAVRRIWRRRHVYELLAELYDDILVRGCREIFDVVTDYDLSPEIAAKTIYCGYVLPEEPVRPASQVRAELGVGTEPLIVVTAGGGADGAPLMETDLDARQQLGVRGPHSLITTGPLMPPEQQAAIGRRAAAIPKTTVVPFVTEHLSYLNAADVIVTQAGYNTMAAVLGLGKRAIVVPAFGRGVSSSCGRRGWRSWAGFTSCTRTT